LCDASSIAIHTSGTLFLSGRFFSAVGKGATLTEAHMNGLIYLIGLIVVIMAILSFFGLR
jgi:hypothetical protein